tara:strand:+ start:277 stop:726 length:450 start_codon:yes stop_codon:yes gene_type:complete
MERTYNIPLRKHFRRTSKWKKTKKAVSGLQQFLKRHMKVEKVKLGPKLNEELWSKGGKNPPHHVKVDVISDDGVAKAELSGHKYIDKAELKKEAEKKKEEKPEEIKKKEEKPEEIKKTEEIQEKKKIVEKKEKKKTVKPKKSNSKKTTS